MWPLFALSTTPMAARPSEKICTLANDHGVLSAFRLKAAPIECRWPTGAGVAAAAQVLSEVAMTNLASLSCGQPCPSHPKPKTGVYSEFP